MSDLNYNIASNTNYKIEISDAPEFNYFIQSVSVPSIRVNEIEMSYRNEQVFFPSNKIQYDPLNITFIVSEDLKNYIFLQKWMIKAAKAAEKNEIFKDVTLHILNNNKLANIEFVFYDCFPTSITEINLESGVVDTSPLVCTVIFRYQYFEVIDK